MKTHECVFPEEKEPSGRLILASCLDCGYSAMDAMTRLKERVAEQAKDMKDYEEHITEILREKDEKLQALEAENKALDLANNEWQEKVYALEARNKELETQLDAWMEVFGTTQLTHAIARLEAAESRKELSSGTQSFPPIK